jgi:hypothetical protein
MLNAFSNETCIEGYAADGSLGYGFYGDAPAFISLAHAFSTGPTYSLTAFVAGLRVVRGFDVDEHEGKWVWMPGVQGSRLDWVKGGFVAPTERSFEVEWVFNEEWFWGVVWAPEGEVGTVYVPILAKKHGRNGKRKVQLIVNGIEVDQPARDDSKKYLRLDRVSGGKTEVLLRYTAQ